MKLLTTPSQRADIIASSCLRDMVSRHDQTRLAVDCNTLQAEVDRLRVQLDEARAQLDAINAEAARDQRNAAKAQAEAAKLLDEVERLRRPLLSFIETIEATGGVNENLEPVADEDWQDLGEAYAEACSALGVPMKQTEDNA